MIEISNVWYMHNPPIPVPSNEHENEHPTSNMAEADENDNVVTSNKNDKIINDNVNANVNVNVDDEMMKRKKILKKYTLHVREIEGWTEARLFAFACSKGHLIKGLHIYGERSPLERYMKQLYMNIYIYVTTIIIIIIIIIIVCYFLLLAVQA